MLDLYIHHNYREHLYRKHGPKHTCGRCFLSFSDATELANHVRSAQACVVRPEGGTNGHMSATQQSQLRSKKRAPLGTTDEDRWDTIYRVLFPSEQSAKIPSPCE
jgi:hypothetical protein